MMIRSRRALFLIACLFAGFGGVLGQDPIEEGSKQEKPSRSTFSQAGTPSVDFVAPPFKTEASSSSMRLESYILPGKPPGECVVYWFGAQGAGGVDANIQRWVSQISSDQKPKREKLEVSEGITATIVDTSGRYVAPVRPGSEARHDRAGWRLMGVVLETSGGNLYIKSVGPEATLEAAQKDLLAWIKSFRVVKK